MADAGVLQQLSTPGPGADLRVQHQRIYQRLVLADGRPLQAGPELQEEAGQSLLMLLHTASTPLRFADQSHEAF